MDATLSPLPEVTQMIKTVSKVFAGPVKGPDEPASKDRVIVDTYTLTLYDFNGAEKRMMQASTIDILV